MPDPSSGAAAPPTAATAPAELVRQQESLRAVIESISSELVREERTVAV